MWALPYWMIASGNRVLVSIHIGSYWWFQASWLKMMRRLDGDYALDLTSQLTKGSESYQVCEIWKKNHGCKVVTYNKSFIHKWMRAWTRPSKQYMRRLWWFGNVMLQSTTQWSNKYYIFQKCQVLIWNLLMENWSLCMFVPRLMF
jgi:hypothetical protein